MQARVRSLPMEIARALRSSIGNSSRIKILFAVAILPLTAVLTACGSGPAATDYSQSAHWVSLPAAVKPVDIFYYYPTVWDDSSSLPAICAIDEPSMRSKAPQALAVQASAFAPVGNLFAPYYRQANSSPIDREDIIGGTPTTDGIAAFDYYIRHYNNGRPFILVGHSQGANILSNLLAQYMSQHRDVYQRMIAAYIIGYSVTDDYLTAHPYLKFAQGPDDTGVIVSYNTEAPDVAPGANPVLYAGVGRVINPITWTTDATEAGTAQGLGSFMPNPQTGQFQQVPQYADAKIDKDRGVLIAAAPNENLMFAMSGTLGKGVYHSFDVQFYYFNLQANAANRAAKFLAAH
jgi:pimeloyl-ACP methyl ester carboxylesterase